ncbi:MAG: flagellar brake protein [Methylohalobius sp.]|nr:flagellar brake protein [Methylohalobius sp.]
MSEPNSEQFFLHTKAEIVRVLRALMQQRCIISASIEGNAASLATALLWVDPDHDRIALDCSPHPKINQKVLESKKLFCLTSLEHIEVKFVARELQEAKFQGQPVFCAQLPETLYYPQKRQIYRLTLAKTLPVRCRLTLEGDKSVLLPALDLGIGGVGLFDSTGAVALSEGAIYSNCCMELPGVGEIRFDLQVRWLLDLAPGRRIGGAFVNLKPKDAILLQRYLNQEQIKLRQTMPDKPSSPPPTR